MTGALLAQVAPGRQLVLAESADGEPTLDDLIVSVWEGLAAHAQPTCPVCDGEMRPQYSAGARPIGGHCLSCGSTVR